MVGPHCKLQLYSRIQKSSRSCRCRFLSRCVPKDDNTKERIEKRDENEEENNAIIIHQITSGVHAIETGDTQTETRSQQQDQSDNIREDTFKQEQNKDENIQMVKEWIMSGNIPQKAEMLKKPIEQRQYAGILAALNIQQDGLPVRKKLPQEYLEVKETRPCIPKTLQEKLIMQTHQQA